MLNRGIMPYCKPQGNVEPLGNHPRLSSHGFENYKKATLYLVEQRSLFLRSTSGCGVWCLPSAPIYCARGPPRRNCCALAAGIIWVRLCLLGPKSLPYRALKGSLSGTTACTLIELSMRHWVYV